MWVSFGNLQKCKYLARLPSFFCEKKQLIKLLKK